jgi:glycosyltransferase involved in cell wall biosynthesis
LKDIKVSVLISNYNNQKYLIKCINSIKKQTYKNIEIIIHDDYSSNKKFIQNKYQIKNDND